MKTPRLTTAVVAEQLSLFAVPDVVPTGDGRYLVVPRKPVVKCSVSDAVRLTGVRRDNIYQLIAAGLIECERPSPRKMLVNLESLRVHLEASREPGYWTPERTAAYHGKK